MDRSIVCKFGGSSLADAACFRRVRDIIRSDPRRRHIVVSAPGRPAAGGMKITDMLIAAAEADGQRRHALLNDVRSRFCRICMDLGLHPPYRQLAALDSYARAGRDALASRGEYLCGMIMAEYLQMPFVDAAEIFVFRDGIPDDGPTLENLRHIGESAVIPGFYGADTSGRIVTFARGGSDISAAYAAAGVGAALYENWTDVSGFHTADPAMVPDALPIRSLCTRQAKQFSRAGACIIHYDSIAPAADAGIPIRILNTFAPGHPGTLISPGMHCELPCVAARKISENEYAVTACNLDAETLLALRSISPGGLEYSVCGGALCACCSAELMPAAMQALHRMCIDCKKSLDFAPE